MFSLYFLLSLFFCHQVVASETQPQLLMALIEGPLHTPYRNCPYIFYMGLTSMFPKEPPKAKIQSYGLRLNPNLYADGYICRMCPCDTLPIAQRYIITKTQIQCRFWVRGTDSRPARSGVRVPRFCRYGLPMSSLSVPHTHAHAHPYHHTQVLISIQGLVLTKEPYYNEAGIILRILERKRSNNSIPQTTGYHNHLGTAEGRQNSKAYNEQVCPPLFTHTHTHTDTGLPVDSALPHHASERPPAAHEE